MTHRLITLLLICLLTACNATAAAPNTTTENQTTQVTTAQSIAGSTSTATTTATSTVATTATAVLAENSTPEAIETIATESSSAVQITLRGDTIDVEGAGVTVAGRVATITAGGIYNISGTLDDGQIVVNTTDDATVHLVLSGATITSASSAPLYIQQAEATEIILADNTQNYLTDAGSYVYASADADEPNAALFSDDALIISGGGSLTVDANYNDGIASKDGLTITGGTFNVTAVDDGIRGKDYLIVENGNITVNAGGDGLKSDNADDATLGYIAIMGGVVNVTAGGDGMQAETDLVMTAGDVAVMAGGGSDATLAADASAKGLKAEVNLTIEGGTVAVNAADDGLHSNANITINGGAFAIASGDDGLHGETTLTINGGNIQITKSYEGIESGNITLNAGTVSIVSSDDAVNAASNDGTTTTTTGRPQGGRGGPMGGGGNFTLTINGGTLVMDAAGDGLDANGTITMTDGLVIVNGPTERMNGAVDYDGGFTLSGGTLVAVGSAGMVAAPDNSSTQNSLLVYFSGTQQAGTLVHIQDSAGNTVLTFAPTKDYQSLVFSALNLTAGETYELYLGGSTTAEMSNGLAGEGTYTGGTLYSSFTVSGTVTQVGNGGGGFR